jgi:hypothetical protein
MLCTMPRIAQLDGLDELLDKQLCVVSRGQLLALGMTDKVTQYRVRRIPPRPEQDRYAWIVPL